MKGNKEKLQKKDIPFICRKDISWGEKARVLGNFKALAMGIIKQACDDYILGTAYDLRTIKKFFLSEYYVSLSDIPGDFLIEQLDIVNDMANEVFNYGILQGQSANSSRWRLKVKSAFLSPVTKGLLVCFEYDKRQMTLMLYDLIMNRRKSQSVKEKMHLLKDIYFPEGLRPKGKVPCFIKKG